MKWLVACLFLLAGCDEKLNPGTVIQTSRCTQIEVTYADTIEPIMTKYCTECHSSSSRDRQGAPVEINYNTYSRTKQNAKAAIRAMGSQTMPPSGDNVTELEMCEFQRWINEGYPQ